MSANAWLILRDIATGHVVYREPDASIDYPTVTAAIRKTFPRASVIARLSDSRIGFARRPLRILSAYAASDRGGNHRLSSSLFELWGCDNS